MQQEKDIGDNFSFLAFPLASRNSEDREVSHDFKRGWFMKCFARSWDGLFDARPWPMACVMSASTE